MSRKCPDCKKWLASGQYTCRYCGAGEQVQTDESIAQVKNVEELVQAIKHVLIEDRTAPMVNHNNPKRVKLVAELEQQLSADAELAKRVAHYDHGQLVVYCVILDCREALRLLLPHVQDVDKCFAADPHNWSPLAAAICLWRSECVVLLLQWGASAEHVGRDGTRAYQHAVAYDARTGYRVVAQLLPSYLGTRNHHSVERWCEERLKEIRRELDVARQIMGREEGASEWSSRAIANAQGVETPAMFPRNVWIKIMESTSDEIKAVVMPRVSRFFRNLIPLKERKTIVWHMFSFAGDVPESFDHVFASRLLTTLQLPLGSPIIEKHIRGTIANAEKIGLNPDLRRLVLEMTFLRDTVNHNPGNKRDSKPIEQTTLTDRATGRFIRLELTPDPKGVIHKMVVSDPQGIGRVSFSLHTARFGESEGGTAGRDRLQGGVERACEVLRIGLMTNEEFVEFLSLLFSGVRFQWTEAHKFFPAFLLDSTAELRVHRSEPLEVSQDFVESDSVGVSIIALMRYNTKRLSEWMGQNGVDPLIVQHVLDEGLKGRDFINSASFADFVPDSVTSIRERGDLADSLTALKDKFCST